MAKRDVDVEALQKGLAALGLGDKSVTSTLKNKRHHSKLERILSVVGDSCNGNSKVGNQLVMLATKLDDLASFDAKVAFALPYIQGEKLGSNEQVTEAIKYLGKFDTDADSVSKEEFEKACGAGIVVSAEEVEAAVTALFEAEKEELLAKRYTYPKGNLLAALKATDSMRWASGGDLVKAVNKRYADLLGPQTAEDKAALAAAKGKKKGGGKKKEKKKKEKKEKKEETKSKADMQAENVSLKNDFEARALDAAKNSKEQIEEHAKITNGRIRTRFPPEPNGYLHIGHAKSMNLNFKGAFQALGTTHEKGGFVFFRYDDTNPEAESTEFIDSIADNVKWMGWTPDMVTHSSDYFDELYDFAIKLIKDGKAYVCHQTGADIEKSRKIAKARKGGDPNSPWRGRTVEENLLHFQRMRDGFYKEGEAALRGKMDMTHSNPNFWDPVWYRIKFCEHPRSGDKWCIYPSYDFTHCIVDALEHIDYSLCTLEFENRRDSYYWLLEQLDLWRPKVYEFSRLVVTYTMMSKRKIKKLVEDKAVRGWDDPRLCTIDGLRRRGFTPRGLNAFVGDLGVTRNVQSVVEVQKLHYWGRWDLNNTSPRVMAVLDPVLLVISNWSDERSKASLPAVLEKAAQAFPQDGESFERGTRSLRFDGSAGIFIERSDFKNDAGVKKSFFGLAPGKSVRLKYIGLIVTCTEVETDASGRVTKIVATYDPEGKGKPKGTIHWVSARAEDHIAGVEIRQYKHLFLSEDCGVREGRWEDDLNPESELVISGAVLEKSELTAAAKLAPITSRFQFERLGYYVLDKDSALGGGGGGGGGKSAAGAAASAAPSLVFNRTLELRDSSAEGKTKSAALAARREEARKKKKAQQARDKGGAGAASALATAAAEGEQPLFTKLDIRVGKILKVWEHPESEKLWCEEIDVGEDQPRQIASGLRKFMTAEEMVGADVLVVCNLKAAKMGGFASNGMVMCSKVEDSSKVAFVRAAEGAKVGERVFLEGEGPDTWAPAKPNAVKRKKVLEKTLPELKTDADSHCTWSGKRWATNAGLCVATMANAPIS